MPRASLRRGAIAASGVTSLTPPIRATFYYSWFTGGSNPTYPGSWEQGGVAPWTQYHPVRGYYDQANTSIIDAHIGDLLYGKFAAGIATWWGQGSTTDGEFQILLDRAAALGTGFRWCIYYEAEGNTIAGVTGSPNPTSAQITSDLNYITTNYTHHPNYLHVAGKPVIFAFGDPSDDNTVTTNILNRPAARWKTATNNAAQPWYYVLKVYVGYTTDHATYPAASWHQYGPATAVDQQGSYSYNISPGFWLATETTPRLARNPTTFATNVRNMLAANVDWKLVTSYNEWGEGHPVEAADSGSGRNYVGSGWTSTSGRGTYLDILHLDGNTTSYDAAVLADSPVALWDADGTDLTANGHTGTLINTPTTTTLPNGSPAALFDGINQYIDLGDDIVYSPSNTGRFTVEAWIRPDVLEFPNDDPVSGYVTILGKEVYGPTTAEWAVRIYSLTNPESRPNRISGYAFNSGGGTGVGSYFQQADYVVAGEWHHIVLVINKADAGGSYPHGYTRIYVDGTSRDQDDLYITASSTEISPSNTTAPVRIATDTLDSWFKGAIGRVAIYNTELSAARITAHYNTMLGAKTLSDSGTCTASLTVTTGSEITITTAYVTGYTWFDNTPPGSATISDPIIHSVADGTGTYADPITVAVGWSTGPTVMDYDPGTIMYMPYLRRYFIVEDKCGDVVPPQNGPCHDLSTADAGATTWVDIWIDGQGGTESAVQNCANTITGIHTIIINPVSTYPVVSGSVYNNGCSQMY